MNWRDDAACKGKTNIFFAPARERGMQRVVREANAIAICATCTVRPECRREAVGEFGVWAGEPEDSFV